jgi:hypothetical protein
MVTLTQLSQLKTNPPAVPAERLTVVGLEPLESFLIVIGRSDVPLQFSTFRGPRIPAASVIVSPGAAERQSKDPFCDEIAKFAANANFENVRVMPIAPRRSESLNKKKNK